MSVGRSNDERQNVNILSETRKSQVERGYKGERGEAASALFFSSNVPCSEETNSFPLPLADDVTQEEISASISPRNVFLARWNSL